MYGKLHSACLYGIDGVLIEVETDLSNGLPQTSIIGYIVSISHMEQIQNYPFEPYSSLHISQRFDLAF